VGRKLYNENFITKIMKLISHRGNIEGVIESSENDPQYIDKALNLGYDVEIDIWYVDKILYSGHDAPTYTLDLNWLLDRKEMLWIHSKNITSLKYMKDLDEHLHYFWHQTDDITITSKGFFWTYPGKELTNHSIAVLPEKEKFNNIEDSYGICSDFIKKYR